MEPEKFQGVPDDHAMGQTCSKFRVGMARWVESTAKIRDRFCQGEGGSGDVREPGAAVCGENFCFVWVEDESSRGRMVLQKSE